MNIIIEKKKMYMFTEKFYTVRLSFSFAYVVEMTKTFMVKPRKRVFFHVFISRTFSKT